MRSAFYTTEKLGPKQSLTPEGFLLCAEVPLARIGVMIYGPDETPIKAGPEGIVKIVREAEDVFTPETLASAQGKPVTNDHPDEDVTPENWKDLSHGTMLNVRRGDGVLDDLMIGDLLVTTKEGIAAVRSGKVEVSLGYEADYEETGLGVGKQTNIIINHIALVDQGRCGPRCAISDAKPNLKGTGTMKTKSNRILDALMKAFKAKDAAEVEELAKKVDDEMQGDPDKTGDTHIHIHSNGTISDAPGEGADPAAAALANAGATGGEGGAEGAKTIDDAFAEHVQQNASEHADLAARIQALEAAVQALGGTGGTATDEEAEVPSEALDEFPEEVKEEASKAKDSKYFADSFQDTVAMAEILVPGIRVPTFDGAQKPGTTFKKICGLRRQALDLAYAQPATRATLDDVLGGKELNTKNMTCDAVRTLFRAAASAQRNLNNAQASRTGDTTKSTAKVGPRSLADINRLNAEKYATK